MAQTSGGSDSDTQVHGDGADYRRIRWALVFGAVTAIVALAATAITPVGLPGVFGCLLLGAGAWYLVAGAEPTPQRGGIAGGTVGFLGQILFAVAGAGSPPGELLAELEGAVLVFTMYLFAIGILVVLFGVATGGIVAHVQATVVERVRDGRVPQDEQSDANRELPDEQQARVLRESRKTHRRWALIAGLGFTIPVFGITWPLLWYSFAPVGSSLRKTAWILGWTIPMFGGATGLWLVLMPRRGSAALGAIAGGLIALFAHSLVGTALSVGIGQSSGSWAFPLMGSIMFLFFGVLLFGVVTIPLSLGVGAILGHLQGGRAPEPAE